MLKATHCWNSIIILFWCKRKKKSGDRPTNRIFYSSLSLEKRWKSQWTWKSFFGWIINIFIICQQYLKDEYGPEIAKLIYELNLSGYPLHFTNAIFFLLSRLKTFSILNVCCLLFEVLARKKNPRFLPPLNQQFYR